MRTTFEEELIRKEKIIYPNVGSSMMPLIRQGKDVMIITRPASWKEYCGDTVVKLKRLDVPLYKRDNGTYVLHRVLKVRKRIMFYVVTTVAQKRMESQIGISWGY